MNSEVNGILVAAHELKGPLAVLRQLALSLELADTDAEISHIQSEMVTVSDRAIKQVNDLAKIARLEDGLFVMEPVAVRAVCDDIIHEIYQLFSVNNRQVRVKYTNRSRLVTANRDLLSSVIYNFLTNAIYYSDANTTSELLVCDSKNKVKVSVRDFGPALPMKIWRDLKNGTLSRPTNIAMRPGSSGLGLYIAAKFSHYMNANVGAVRHRDGTSFFIEIPISTQARLF